MKKRIVASLLAVLVSVPSFAAGEALKDALNNPMVWIGFTILIFLIISFAVVKNALDVMKEVSLKAQGRWEEVQEKEAEESSQIMQALTAAVPIERENEILTDHDYDGIQELDNRLPPWWLYGFYVSIIFAVVYLIRFHVTGDGMNSQEELAAEYAAFEAEQKAALSSGAIVELNADELEPITSMGELAFAEDIFTSVCASCHKADGGGSTGPNLTDEYWKHGGGISNVYTTIKEGVAGTSMAPWGTRYSDEKIHQIASYVLMLQGTNPPDALPADGELWVAPEPVAEAESETVEEAADETETTDAETSEAAE
ncbi:cbb3-type cytochrome c oxidase N-terminal domain-containing protein [Phaeocystidibacter luteus]|uniref:C-type cytochrome n=1 Tax=Phaeocystidibacter luteus TaxID=911197 RepID=A0A6N6RKM9_9FLAO|nr:cbb3-type cytochrome c oxidase N-terminal domain-containing protein [Phaeocystidibacter luteus]KAB2813610.1 c-type cytochrome [Phaeocystidibacter luteus]